MSKYIAVKTIGNGAGLGIVEIDHTDNLVNFEVLVGDKVIDIVNSRITDKFNDDVEEYETGFYWGQSFQPLSEFIRVE